MCKFLYAVNDYVEDMAIPLNISVVQKYVGLVKFDPVKIMGYTYVIMLL